MILAKYTKLDRAVYLGHLDVLKMFGMAIRRKAIPVEYSKGFNRHILLFMSQPLSLGLASECEYFCIDSKYDPEEFKEKMNDSLPDGIRLSYTTFVGSNPNVSALMRAADYEVEIEENVNATEKINEIMSLPRLETEIGIKGNKIVKDIKPLIFEVNADNKSLRFKAACGNINLKADKFIEYIEKNSDIRAKGFITKKHLYTEAQGKLIDIDEFLKMKKT